MSFTDFKEVTSNNSGSATRYGGNDLKEVMQILNNKTVASRRVSIKNPWIFTDYFDMKPPVGVPANPTDTNASRIYADPSDSKIKIKKVGGAVVDVENLNIANAALNQITDKAKLHSSIVYGDQNNSLGAFWHDVAQISTPSNPAAGTRRVFVNSATGELSVRTSAGVTTSLESGAGGVGDVQLNATNTYGDFDSIFRSSRVKIRNPANTFSYALVGSAITAARNLTLPLLTADDTVVTTTFGQTLTTKTINVDQNTIKDSTTNAAGDILKGNATSFVRFARGTANQVLSVNAGGTDLVWATPAGGGNVSTTGVNTYGDFDQIFRSGRLDVTNPANTFNYSITGSAITATRAVTIPLLTADDTFVTAAFTQTLTNKTVNTTDNSLTATSQATGDVLRNDGTKFVRLARGTALQVLRVNSGGTDIQYASLDSERIGKHTASGNGSTTVFNIAHGLGSNPTYCIVSVAQSGSTSINRSYTTDATNIVVTFASAPASGTNNVIINWIVVA